MFALFQNILPLQLTALLLTIENECRYTRAHSSRLRYHEEKEKQKVARSGSTAAMFLLRNVWRGGAWRCERPRIVSQEYWFQSLNAEWFSEAPAWKQFLPMGHFGMKWNFKT